MESMDDFLAIRSSEFIDLRIHSDTVPGNSFELWQSQYGWNINWISTLKIDRILISSDWFLRWKSTKTEEPPLSRPKAGFQRLHVIRILNMSLLSFFLSTSPAGRGKRAHDPKCQNCPHNFFPLVLPFVITLKLPTSRFYRVCGFWN